MDLDVDDLGRILSFGVFALRDLRSGLEVVLDSGSKVPSLRGLLKAPGVFPSVFLSYYHIIHARLARVLVEFMFAGFYLNSNFKLTYHPHPLTWQHIQHLRLQITNILHTLSSTFTTCRLMQMAVLATGQDEFLSLINEYMTRLDLGLLAVEYIVLRVPYVCAGGAEGDDDEGY